MQHFFHFKAFKSIVLLILRGVIEMKFFSKTQLLTVK